MSNNDFGISNGQALLLIDIFRQYFNSGVVLIYGSRAKGNFTETSDFDIVLKNTETKDRNKLADLIDEIIESDFPYLCDIQYYEDVKTESLIDHINRVGKELCVLG